MTLHAPTFDVPAADAGPAAFGAYWLGVAEDDYASKRFDAAAAAAQIANAHLQTAQMDKALTVDAYGLLGPRGSELTAENARTAAAAGTFSR